MSNKRQNIFTTASGLAGLTIGVAGTLIWNNRDKIKNSSILKNEQVEALKTKADDVVQFVQSNIEKIKATKTTPVNSTNSEGNLTDAPASIHNAFEETVSNNEVVASPEAK